ncbi:uncharacterized protein PFL1_01530 [Pseudozyma flocculosa PF-1]|uniref:ubiquitinyl hydrolase 1 n=1 Tax=Pseudozyma flocculosa TaxID=84751 RepID=A0A5C3F0R4_9BASI|nr:uncharacterized protein PFL1_01530 [Pseudozyma flocculosa PF-1]EPQ30629.1 hypothetical protein PFL1_01530 [Pseudozyma flocculosa PF-1]SPO37039.1 uncharacterized protein PSFLO_02511 [Pseudozyma flocculosa]
MEGINADTKLESLTDQQRIELAQKLRDEQTANQPLISEVQPIEVLLEEYADNDGFIGKIKWLRDEGRFIGLRRAKGDGDCFYRAFAFAFIHKILLMNDRPLHHFVVKHVEGTLALLKQAGFDEEIYLDFYEPLRRLLARMHSTDPETQELNDHALLEAINDPETSNSIVVYLRLLTSAFLKVNADEYTPFLFALDGDVGSTSGGPPTMSDFCANQVEAIGKEADHVQITALSRALKTSLDVAYLSRAQAPPDTPLSESLEGDSTLQQQQQQQAQAHSQSQQPPSATTATTQGQQGKEIPGDEAAQRRRLAEDPNRCDVVRFDVEDGQMLEIGTMLLRPGHYDLLVEAPAPASPEIEIPPVASGP